jgi:uncharacterized protein YccT (UPF0319 family)
MIKKVLISTLPFVAFNAFSSVEITLPKSINILAVNESNNVAQYLNNETLTLPDGKSQFVFDIRKTFKPGSSQAYFYQSVPVIITLDGLNGSATLITPSIDNEQQSLAYDKRQAKDKFSLSSVNNITNVEADNLSKGWLSLTEDFADASRLHNKDKNIVLGTNSKSAAVEPLAQTETKNIQAKASISNNLEITQDYFNKLSKQEKQKFLSWAVSNID